MLHATLNGSINSSVIKELLKRGVNPYRKNKNEDGTEGKTYLEYIKAELKGLMPPEGDAAPEVVQLYQRQVANYQAVISMVNNFMLAHPETECKAREAAIKAAAQAGTWVSRRDGLTGGERLPPSL